MRTSTAIQWGAATVAVLDVAIAVEAIRVGQPGIAVAAVLAVIGAVTVLVTARRPTVELRRDAADWTARTAAATGEDETDIVHRALARHRAALDGERGPDG